MRLRTTHVALATSVALTVGAGIAHQAGPAPLAGPTSTSVVFTASGDFSHSSQASAVLTQVGTLSPDLHIALGDLSYTDPGLEDAWCDFVTARVGTGFPFELITGNHESNGGDGNINDFSACLPNQLPGLIGTYGRQWYADVPQTSPLVRFIAISPGLTFPSGDWSYAAGSPRYDWTAAAIDNARSAGIPWVVVGMHMPCLSLGAYGCSSGQAINDLMIAKKVDLVLSGHEHSYMRTKQLALGPGCPAVVPAAANNACIVDSDSDLTKGQGAVFATVGTGGTALRNLNPADAEAPYFVTSSGLNSNPTWGNLRVTATPESLVGEFIRAAGGTFTDTFTIGPPDPNANNAPQASFTSSSDLLTVSLDGSSSSDIDGTIETYAWDFGDQTPPGSGVTATHTYASAGSYTVSLTVTDDDGATDTTNQVLSVSGPPSANLVADAFGRSLTSGWGTADMGGPWSSPAGSSVDGSRGVITAPSPRAYQHGHLEGTSVRDLNALVSVSSDKAGSGSGLDIRFISRRVGPGTQYETQAKLLSTGAVQLSLRRVAGGSVTVLTQTTVPGLTYSPGTELRLRTEVVGSTPATIRAKVWPVGSPEPAQWQVQANDSTAALQQAGNVGLATYVSGSATNTPVLATFDDLVVTAP